jgi:hypothetical protein
MTTEVEDKLHLLFYDFYIKAATEYSTIGRCDRFRTVESRLPQSTVNISKPYINKSGLIDLGFHLQNFDSRKFHDK